MRYANLKSDPKALALSERLYIYHPNPLFIRQRAELIMCVNENVCVRHQGYLALLKPHFFSFFFFSFFFFFLLRRSHSIISRGNPPDHGQDCMGK